MSDLVDSPRFKRMLEVPSFTWSEWDSVGLVKLAIRTLELGQFDAAALVVDAMTRDDRISGCMQMRAGCLTSLPFSFEKGQGRLADRAAKIAEKNFERLFSDEALKDLQHWGLYLGVAVAQIVWNQSADGVWPKLEVWHPRYLSWRWDTRSFWVTTATGQVEVTPGDGQWVLYTPFGFSRAWMRGLVRSLYIDWLIRQWAKRDWARWSEVHGTPIRLGHVPTGAQEEDKDRFIRELASIGAESVVRLPRDANGVEFDVTLLEASGEGYQGFDLLLSKTEANIAIRLLGQNLTTEVKGGSYAAGKVHQNIRGDLLESDADALSDCLHEQVAKPWAMFNFGDALSAPKPCWETEEPEDKKETAEALNELGQAIGNLVKGGVAIDGEVLAERMNLPLRDLPEGDKHSLVPLDPAIVAAAGLTKNEVRARLGLKPIEGGDEQPQPVAPPTPGEKPPAPPAKKPAPQKKAEASAGPSLEPAVAGQVYVDQLHESALNEARKLVGGDITVLLDAVEASSDFDDLRKRIVKAYSALETDQLAELLTKVMLLAELNGRDAVKDETETAE